MTSRSRRFWLLATVVLIVPLAFVLYPVSRVVEGVGTIEPLFEDLILITTDVSGMVTRLRVGLHQDVEQGTPLFEYVPDGQWSVLGPVTMSRPSGSPPEPSPTEPEWYREGNRRRVARAEALRGWTKRLYAPAPRPLAWERLLEQRLGAKVHREDDVAMAEARAAENVRLGHPEFNLVHVFDRGAGMSRETDEGEPVPSAVAGRVYSLWITQRSQFSGAGPLGEIMRRETPLEVFGRCEDHLSELARHARQRLRTTAARPGAGSRRPRCDVPDHLDVARASPSVALAQRRLARLKRAPGIRRRPASCVSGGRYLTTSPSGPPAPTRKW